MSDPEFFRQRRELSVAEIAALVGAPGPTKFLKRRIGDIASLDRAGPGDLTFAMNDGSAVRQTRAGACLVANEVARALPAAVAALAVSDPYRAFVRVAETLFPDATRPSSLFEGQGRSSNATVHPSARLEPGVTIDPGAVIGPRAEIGSGTLIGAMAVIGPDVRIGRDCRVGPGASVTHALLGDRVIVHTGARIGDSLVGDASPKLAAAGRVIIQDGTEIGANSTISRGALGDTVIGEGARIGDLASIPGDLVIDRHCVILGAAASLPGPVRRS